MTARRGFLGALLAVLILGLLLVGAHPRWSQFLAVVAALLAVGAIAADQRPLP